MLRISCLQSSGTPDAPQANIEELEHAARQAAEQEASLLITPELFLTGYDIGESVVAWADEPLLARAQRVASRYRMHLIVGLPRRITGEVYNCAVFIDKTGEVVDTYAKSHLFGALDRRYFAAGDRPYALVTVDGVRVAMMICYDVEFPETVRDAALAGAHLVAVPTAQMEPFAFVATTVVATRAWENQLYLAYANRIGAEQDTVYVGRSSIVEPGGTPLASASLETTLLTATVDAQAVTAGQRANPYLADRRPELYAVAGSTHV